MMIHYILLQNVYGILQCKPCVYCSSNLFHIITNLRHTYGSMKCIHMYVCTCVCMILTLLHPSWHIVSKTMNKIPRNRKWSYITTFVPHHRHNTPPYRSKTISNRRYHSHRSSNRHNDI